LRYMTRIQEPYSALFGFWHKVLQGWQGSVEIQALALSVSIEGLISSYFEKYGASDNDMLEQSKKAKDAIKSLDIGERIKNRLLSNIGEVKRPNTKTALFAIAKHGLFDKSQVDTWVSLRNKSAHPDYPELDTSGFQQLLDQIYCCLSLFYKLIFIITHYEGVFRDSSLEGWPDKEFIVPATFEP
jgi:hypothetical protein